MRGRPNIRTPGHAYAVLLLNGYQAGKVKIGFTTRDVTRRAKEIIIGTYATDAEVLCALSGTAFTERRLHAIFRNFCETDPIVSGHEWFVLPNRYVKRLRRLGGHRSFHMMVPLTPRRAENAERMGRLLLEAS